jgi:transposase
MAHPFRTQGINEVRSELGKLFDAGRKDDMLDMTVRLLEATATENDRLALAIKELTNRLYGRRSERISEDQLRFLFELLSPPPSDGQPAADKPKFAPDEPAVPERPSEADPRLKKKRRGQKSLPAHLPREEVRIPPNEEQLQETTGGMRLFSEEVSEVLEYEPGRFKVIRYVREIWSNLSGEIVRAPAPAKVIDKGLPGPNLLAHVVVSKYRDHCPLNRQVAIYRREGVELSRNTLVDWIAAAAFLLQPLARLIYSLVMVAQVLRSTTANCPYRTARRPRTSSVAICGRWWATTTMSRIATQRTGLANPRSNCSDDESAGCRSTATRDTLGYSP